MCSPPPLSHSWQTSQPLFPGTEAAWPCSLSSLPMALLILPCFFWKSHGLEYFTTRALHLCRSCLGTGTVNNKNALGVSCCWSVAVASSPTREEDSAGELGDAEGSPSLGLCHCLPAPGMLVWILQSQVSAVSCALPSTWHCLPGTAAQSLLQSTWCLTSAVALAGMRGFR